MEKLPPIKEKERYISRYCYNGQLQHRLGHRQFAHPRTYWVQVERIPDLNALEKLRIKLIYCVKKPAITSISFVRKIGIFVIISLRIPSLARNRVGIELSYRPARLHRWSELIPWNLFLGSLNV